LKHFIENPAAPAMKVAISQYPKKAPEGPVMGYSIRDARWRATFWRERDGAKIVATELYDEQNDPDETISLAGKPEHQDLLAKLVKHLPPVGSDAAPRNTAKGNPKAAAKAAPAPGEEDRGARYDRLYPGKAKLTLAEYLAHQSDAEAAKERFTKFDTDRDGFITKEEFVGGGKQSGGK
jgi:hypothetical protein